MSGYSRLARNSAARKALLRDLITDLILNGSIQTTLTKANEYRVAKLTCNWHFARRFEKQT